MLIHGRNNDFHPATQAKTIKALSKRLSGFWNGRAPSLPRTGVYVAFYGAFDARLSELTAQHQKRVRRLKKKLKRAKARAYQK